jgi:hypothetical protein
VADASILSILMRAKSKWLQHGLMIFMSFQESIKWIGPRIFWAIRDGTSYFEPFGCPAHWKKSRFRDSPSYRVVGGTAKLIDT